MGKLISSKLRLNLCLVLQIGCFAAAVCLYYFYTCVFTWMLVEGVHIYFMVIRVFELTGRGRKRVYLVIGWGKCSIFLVQCFGGM